MIKNNRKNLNIIKVLTVLSILIFASCGQSNRSGQESEPPAKVKNAVEETELSTVELTVKAEERLGIEIFTVEKRLMPKHLEVGAEIVAPPGNSVSVAAPFAGTILNTESGVFPSAGKLVKKGEEILRLLFLPPDNVLIGAREDLTVKQEQFEVAQSKADRAEQLLSSKAISEKAHEEAQVELARAKAALNTARARFNLLNGKDLNTAAGGLSTLVLESPIDGVLQRIHVASGMTVPVSAVLFDVVGLSPVWIRVPVYVGELDKIDLKKDADVKVFGADSDSTVYKAKAIQGPLISDSDSVSSDLYYELDNARRLFRVGQKVSVILTQKSPAENLVVPESAILYDIYGGNWVYTRIAPQTYMRRRVVVSHVAGEFAVLSRGLEEGDEVVSAAAAEIYGTEFGVGK